MFLWAHVGSSLWLSNDNSTLVFDGRPSFRSKVASQVKKTILHQFLTFTTRFVRPTRAISAEGCAGNRKFAFYHTVARPTGTISAEGWSGTNNVERPEKLSTQKLFQHTEAFTERSFYTQTLLHRSVKVHYIVCPLFVAIWYALSWSEARLQAGMMWTYSQLDLDGFKFQASTVSVWWTMCERGASTIELACGVKTWVLSHHQPLLANDCSKIE